MAQCTPPIYRMVVLFMKQDDGTIDPTVFMGRSSKLLSASPRPPRDKTAQTTQQ